eukprot:GFUD01101586.1.p1 GENE.GFUD01101586.1~~GFUD01101586.1.p1  ORF type:complete len:129 (+),score=33.31 GFUD01101586.1:27-413(+)
MNLKLIFSFVLIALVGFSSGCEGDELDCLREVIPVPTTPPCPVRQVVDMDTTVGDNQLPVRDLPLSPVRQPMPPSTPVQPIRSPEPAGDSRPVRIRRAPPHLDPNTYDLSAVEYRAGREQVGEVFDWE